MQNSVIETKFWEILIIGAGFKFSVNLTLSKFNNETAISVFDLFCRKLYKKNLSFEEYIKMLSIVMKDFFGHFCSPRRLIKVDNGGRVGPHQVQNQVQ